MFARDLFTGSVHSEDMRDIKAKKWQKPIRVVSFSTSNEILLASHESGS